MLGVWAVNLTNFMDGIDWITVAEVVPVTAGLTLFGLMEALPQSAFVVALALLGATLGFAPFNRPVARLFLGDVGSLPVGLLLFWLLVTLAGRGFVIAALLLPLYYLADATITLIRRASRGENVFEAHRSHFYQHATKAGWPVIERRGARVHGEPCTCRPRDAECCHKRAGCPVPFADRQGHCGRLLLAWMQRSNPNLKAGTPG